MQVQGSRNYRRSYDARSCPHAGSDSTEDCSLNIYGLSKGEKFAHDLRKACQLKYKYGNRKFWAEGYYVSTVGLNEGTVMKYIREQEAHDQALDKLSVKEYEDPFSSNRSKKK